MRFRSVLVAALLSTLPVVASASPRFSYSEYINYCTTGEFRSCASATLKVWSTSRGSLLLIQFQNREGSDYGFDNTGGSTLAMFQVQRADRAYYGAPYPNETGLNWQSPPPQEAGSVGVLGTAPYMWDTSLDLGWMSLWNLQGMGTGLFGCTPLPIDPNAPSYDMGAEGYHGAAVTCPSQGYPGWVQFSVLVDIPSTASDWEMVWSMSSYPVRPAGGTCSTGDATTCVSMTPEPVTTVLLATGLAGIGGIGAVRRRRGRVGNEASSQG